MSSRKFVYIFTVITFFLLFCNSCVNYKYDMYGVFDKDFSKFRPYFLNERYCKMNYLLNEGFNKYDTFIFGSSRVQKYNPQKLSSKAYNLGYSAGLPYDFLRDINTLVARKYSIKRIIMAVDDFHYKRLPSEVSSNVNFVGYGRRIDNFKYKMSLLCRFPEKNHLKYIMGKLDVPTAKFNITVDGSTVSKNSDSNIDWSAHAKDDIFKKASYIPEKNKRTSEVVSEIKSIKEVCETNGIELIVIFNPVHITSYLANNQDNFQEFKSELNKVVDYYDFATINTITKDNFYWTETSHFRGCVADMILDKVLGNNVESIPHDFGVKKAISK